MQNDKHRLRVRKNVLLSVLARPVKRSSRQVRGLNVAAGLLKRAVLLSAIATAINVQRVPWPVND